MAAGGDGVARLPDGLALFVPLAAPGDRVRIRVTERHRRFARAEISEVLVAGPGRCAPRCPVFGRCGGCAWQHLEYSVQVQAKQAILREALVRIGGWVLTDEIPLTPSPAPYGYRTRARLLVGREGIGYRRQGSHALCAIDGCPILVPSLDAEVGRLAGARRVSPEPAEQGEWELVAGRDGRARSHPVRSHPVRSHPVRSHPVKKHSVKGGGPTELGADRDRIELRAGQDVLAVSPGTFIQANLGLHDALHAAVLDSVGRGRHAIELHAGAGFFTLALARRFEEVEAIEVASSAVADLRANLLSAGLERVRVVEGDVEEVLKSRVGPRPELVLLDPPRAGLSPGALESLVELSAARIVYLSCDPATLARDSARLRERGYALESVQGFDLFPQTPHVEALAVLIRGDAPGG